MSKIESEALGSGSLGSARKSRLKIKSFKVLPVSCGYCKPTAH